MLKPRVYQIQQSRSRQDTHTFSVSFFSVFSLLSSAIPRYRKKSFATCHSLSTPSPRRAAIRFFFRTRKIVVQHMREQKQRHFDTIFQNIKNIYIKPSNNTNSNNTNSSSSYEENRLLEYALQSSASCELHKIMCVMRF